MQKMTIFANILNSWSRTKEKPKRLSPIHRQNEKKMVYF